MIFGCLEFDNFELDFDFDPLSSRLVNIASWLTCFSWVDADTEKRVQKYCNPNLCWLLISTRVSIVLCRNSTHEIEKISLLKLQHRFCRFLFSFFQPFAFRQFPPLTNNKQKSTRLSHVRRSIFHTFFLLQISNSHITKLVCDFFQLYFFLSLSTSSHSLDLDAIHTRHHKKKINSNWNYSFTSFFPVILTMTFRRMWKNNN